MTREMWEGNQAIAEAAVRAGLEAYFGYPITPQTEVAEYLARRMPEVGGVFLQAESEVAASNMIFGAASAGVRVFTTSSSPGISLMQEAMSYITAAELPAVFVNIIRNGPGLGGILPSQGDYFQATRGGGHGDYRMLVLAPSSIQEAVELMMLAFEKADEYRNPVMVVGDGLIGQMMEPVDFSAAPKSNPPDKSPWAATGAKGRKPHVIKTLYLDPDRSEELNQKLTAKYEKMTANEVRFEEYNLEKARDLILVAFGTTARVCKTAIDDLKAVGVEVGLFRPISLYPFPTQEIRSWAKHKLVRQFLTVEMNTGQMLEDVQLAVLGNKPVRFYGRQGGNVPSPEEIIEQCRKLLKK